MTKLKIVMGSFLLAASAFGNEGFTPNGSIGFTQTFYGNSGKYKTETAHPSIELNYSLTKEWSITAGWDRTMNMYDYNGDANEQNNDYSAPYATVTYNHGTLGESKIKWSSSLNLKNENVFAGTNQTYTMAQTVLDFVNYMPKDSIFSPTQFALAPTYVYGWNSPRPSGHVNTGALALLTNWNLPMDFSLTINAVVAKEWYNGDFLISNESGKTYDDATYFAFYAWLKYSKELYKFDSKTNLVFNFTGGYDPYMSSNRDASGWFPYLFGEEQYEWLTPTLQNGEYNNTYIVFALPQFEINYNYNKDITMSLFAQIKYSNQVWGNTEKDWEVQPQGGFSLTYNF